MSSPKLEHFRGVVWPRPADDTDGKPTYRYAIVGMLITDTPIAGLDPNETVIDGTLTRFVDEMGIAGALEHAPKFHAARTIGDANNVLLSLAELVGAPLAPTSPKSNDKIKSSIQLNNRA